VASVSNGWKRKQQLGREPALHNPIDPEHATPDDNEQIWWRDTSHSPGMPDDVEGVQPNIGTPHGGYEDMTPQGGDFGMPAFPGLTLAQGQEIRAIAHEQDFGAGTARRYISPRNRDGVYDVSETVTPDYEGNPAEQNNIRYVTGVGTSYDEGNSVHGRRITRWRERQLDYHWYDVEMRPSYVRQAQTVPQRAVVGDRTQAVSPYSSGEIIYQGDSFVAPMERRTPGPWDQPLVEEGTSPPGADFGLGMWGL
jgi:hypothetical protein